MRQKIESMIVLFTFAATPAAVPSSFVAAFVWTVTKSNELSLIAMLVSFTVFAPLLAAVLVMFAAFMHDRLGEEGQWVTVETTSPTGQTHKKKRYIPPTCTTNGKRDLELERQLRELNQ